MWFDDAYFYTCSSKYIDLLIILHTSLVCTVIIKLYDFAPTNNTTMPLCERVLYYQSKYDSALYVHCFYWNFSSLIVHIHYDTVTSSPVSFIYVPVLLQQLNSPSG